MSKPLRLIFRILLFPVWLTLLVLFWLALLPIALLVAVLQKLRLRRFRRLNDQRTFLICSRRHGWNEFLINNVLPALPDGTTVIWLHDLRMQDFPAAIRSGLTGRTKPFLMRVTRKAICFLEMHERLLDCKLCSRRSRRMRSKVRKRFRAAFEELIECDDS